MKNFPESQILNKMTWQIHNTYLQISTLIPEKKGDNLELLTVKKGHCEF